MGKLKRFRKINQDKAPIRQARRCRNRRPEII